MQSGVIKTRGEYIRAPDKKSVRGANSVGKNPREVDLLEISWAQRELV